MATDEEKERAALEAKHEAFVEKTRRKFQKEHGAGIHYNYALKDNPRLQAFNQVMQEQAKKKVN